MTALSEGTIPLTDAEREALTKIENLVGYTRDGDLLVAEDSDGNQYSIHADGTIEED